MRRVRPSHTRTTSSSSAPRRAGRGSRIRSRRAAESPGMVVFRRTEAPAAAARVNRSGRSAGVEAEGGTGRGVALEAQPGAAGEAQASLALADGDVEVEMDQLPAAALDGRCAGDWVSPHHVIPSAARDCARIRERRCRSGARDDSEWTAWARRYQRKEDWGLNESNLRAARPRPILWNDAGLEGRRRGHAGGGPVRGALVDPGARARRSLLLSGARRLVRGDLGHADGDLRRGDAGVPPRARGARRQFRRARGRGASTSSPRLGSPSGSRTRARCRGRG